MKDFHKYGKIKRLEHEEVKEIFSDSNDEIVVEEKIDGGNFRFMVKDGKVVFGSRTQQLTSDVGEDSNVDKQFRKVVAYVREKLEGKDLSLYDGYIFYGEACFHHTINYDWDKIPPFLGYDIMVRDIYVPLLTHAKEIFAVLELPFVPVIQILRVSDLPEINDDYVPVSEYALDSAEDKKAEGLVFKNYKKQIFAKYVRDRFKERNAEAFGGSPKYNKVGDTNNADLVFKYCTNARIEKIVFKLIDDGNKLELKLMNVLPKLVKMDMFEEEWTEIMFSRWKIDFGLINKAISKRCLAVLQQIISHNK